MTRTAAPAALVITDVAPGVAEAAFGLADAAGYGTAEMLIVSPRAGSSPRAAMTSWVSWGTFGAAAWVLVPSSTTMPTDSFCTWPVATVGLVTWWPAPKVVEESNLLQAVVVLVADCRTPPVTPMMPAAPVGLPVSVSVVVAWLSWPG